jgi:hypothetical protein
VITGESNRVAIAAATRSLWSSRETFVVFALIIWSIYRRFAKAEFMDLFILCVQQGLMKTGKRMSGGETIIILLSVF